MSFVEGLVIIILMLCLTIIVLFVVQSRFVHQGKIIVHTDEEGIHYSLEIDGDPYDIQHMKRVSFKVIKQENIAN